jgi:hypothetical protein
MQLSMTVIVCPCPIIMSLVITNPVIRFTFAGKCNTLPRHGRIL